MNTCCGKLSIGLGLYTEPRATMFMSSDERRCLLERHLQERWKARENDPEELTCAGLAYLERLLSEVSNPVRIAISCLRQGLSRLSRCVGYPRAAVLPHRSVA